MNLKDPKNPGLRHQVLTGKIKPEKIAVMTAEVIMYGCTSGVVKCIKGLVNAGLRHQVLTG